MSAYMIKSEYYSRVFIGKTARADLRAQINEIEESLGITSAENQ